MSRQAILLLTAASAMLGSSIVSAHPHTSKSGQIIATGQNHPIFKDAGNGLVISCDDFPKAGTAEKGPAWYGLETAHHGPDKGKPGKADGCYVTEGSINARGAYVPTSTNAKGLN